MIVREPLSILIKKRVNGKFSISVWSNFSYQNLDVFSDTFLFHAQELHPFYTAVINTIE